MSQDDDEFSAALEGAINGREDEGGDEPFAEASPGAESLGVQAGGGDLDDDQASPSEQARQINAQVARLDQLKQEWAAYHQKKSDELTAAQEAHKRARLATINSDGSNDEALVEAESAALQAVLDARGEVERARQTYYEADRQRSALAEQMPRETEAQRAWMAAHPEYQSDRRFAAEADRIMNRLRQGGMDPAHPAFYRTLDTELRTTPRMGQNARRTPGAPAVRTDSRTGASGRGEVMTRAEATFIRRLGRDPGDKVVQEQWRASKANTRRVAQMQGGFR